MIINKKTVIAGAGRIAWHLGRRLKSKGIPVVQVVNRSADTAQALGEALGVAWTDDFSAVRSDAEWLLIAVRDDAIGDVAAQLAPYVPGVLATHTSGATPGTVLAPYFDCYGVFYPLQSFSFERAPLWSKIPFCVDARQEEDVLVLKQIAKIIGNLVYRVNDAQRVNLHVAAVFANNFANHCFTIAERILEKNDLPFELLHPLMEETLAKALHDSPARMQTGPALRSDLDTIRRHLALLAGNPKWQELYLQLSLNINDDLTGAIELPDK